MFHSPQKFPLQLTLLFGAEVFCSSAFFCGPLLVDPDTDAVLDFDVELTTEVFVEVTRVCFDEVIDCFMTLEYEVTGDVKLVPLEFTDEGFEVEEDLTLPALLAVFVSVVIFFFAMLSWASESASFRTEGAVHTEFVFNFISIPPARV